MRLVLDTHILLWTLAESDRLSPRTREILIDPTVQKRASVVSLWEVAIKTTARRERGDPMPFDAFRARALIEEAGIKLLPVTADHVLALATLPQTRHRDPFDRMLVAQAVAERGFLLTHDAALAAYGNTVLVV